MEQINKLLRELKDLKSEIAMSPANLDLLDRYESIKEELKDLGY